MRYVLIALLIFLSCVNFFAQDKKESLVDEKVIDFSTLQENNDPDCIESNNFTIREGKVTKIINAKTIIFAVDNEYEKETYKVILAGIAVSSNSSILKKFLIENVLNQNATVVGEESKEGNKKIFGIVSAWKPNIFVGEVNRYFLKNGLTKYIEPKRHLVPNWTLCEYRKIAKQAKEAKLGIWAK